MWRARRKCARDYARHLAPRALALSRSLKAAANELRRRGEAGISLARMCASNIMSVYMANMMAFKYIIYLFQILV